jgi:hypothetical protein
VSFFFDKEGYGRDGDVSVRDRSVLGWLSELGERLAEAFPWEKAEAEWFVLTGTVPTVDPVTVWGRQESGPHFSLETITVEAAWWVRPETVEAIFREARGLRRGNRRVRQIGEKNLKLFRFTTERSDAVGKLQDGNSLDVDMAGLEYEKRPMGRQLVEEWNQIEWVKKDPKKRAYKPENSRIFLRDYQRAREEVAYVPSFESNELAVAAKRKADSDRRSGWPSLP